MAVRGAVDICMRGLPTDCSDVSRALAVKGFCVIDPKVSDAKFENVLADFSALDGRGRLARPAAPLLEGLLGPGGSYRIAELSVSDNDEFSDYPRSPRGSQETLQYFENQLTDFLTKLIPSLSSFNLPVNCATGCVLHEAGFCQGDGPPLTDEVCSKWLSVFSKHRVMAVWCLGPEDGTLELQPFDEGQGYEVAMRPGLLVLLRADALSHRFRAIGSAYCLTSFLLKSKNDRGMPVIGPDATPCCKVLHEFAEARVAEYNRGGAQDKMRADLPRGWELWSHRVSFVGQQIGVASYAGKNSSSHQPEEWVLTFSGNPDFVTQIPMMRWSMENFYEADEEAWRRQKSYCCHGSFIDGAELFDNLIFRISRSEASGMDPGHRLTLETGYEAMCRAGYKGKMMNTRGGVYCAVPDTMEWGTAPKDCTSQGVCGSGGSIACGRFSFIHGLKGPCISVDVEGASSLVAVNFASTNLSTTGRWEPIPFAVCSAYHLQLSPMSFIMGCSTGAYTMSGRCFAYDATASGYVRGDGVVSMVLKAYTDMVDGQVVVKKEDFIGQLMGSATNQSGRRAGFTAPDSAATQEVIFEAVRQASISCLDVDACETAAPGKLLHDSLEASATAKGYRPEGMSGADEASPVCLLSTINATGNLLEAAGMAAILKVMLGFTSILAQHPTCHLRVLNPFVDLDICERNAVIGTEAIGAHMMSCITGISGRSVAGTNCHAICFSQAVIPEEYLQARQEQEALASAPVHQPRQEKILFWPAGGGTLEPEMRPTFGYSIAGTFSRWRAVDMESEGSDVWGFTVLIGENRFERFHILLDGDRGRVLHPGIPEASMSTPVCGPEVALQAMSWRIDASKVSRGQERYRVRLRVSGKWRTVDWEKLEDLDVEILETSDYQVVGSWSEDMLPEDLVADGNVHALEVTLPSRSANFQILRNSDWQQVIHPGKDKAVSGEVAAGPDMNPRYCWELRGQPGDIFRIELQRSALGLQVGWTSQGRQDVPKPKHRRPSFHVKGNWMDGGPTMRWTGQYYQYFLQMGKRLKPSFVLSQDGNRSRCFYPSLEHASPFDSHELHGPSIAPVGIHWTVGHHELDRSGRFVEIRLKVGEDNLPIGLTWGAVTDYDELEDAAARGFLAIIP